MLNNNGILMYWTYNEDKSVVSERFVRTLKVNIYIQMTDNDSKSYLRYLNKLLNEYNYSYHGSIGKKPINADCFALPGEIATNLKVPKFKAGDRVTLRETP